MICIIVVCALVAETAKTCDLTKPSSARYIEAAKVIEKQADCAGALDSARAMRKPGEWPFRYEIARPKPPKDDDQ